MTVICSAMRLTALSAEMMNNKKLRFCRSFYLFVCLLNSMYLNVATRMKSATFLSDSFAHFSIN